IDAARAQAEQVRQWVRGTKDYFKPIERLPTGQLTDASFAGAMHQTISQLQREADAGSVSLPPGYNFSFQAQSDKVRFAPGSLDKLAVQLGEVKTITEMLYGAHINALEGIQRLRVSEDDTLSTAADYIDEPVTTTELGTLTPYQVTFRGFSSEIAQVLQALATSPHGFVVKTVSVQPAVATFGGTDMATPPVPTPAGRGPQMLLTEQMLRVTMMIEIVKLTPGR
ncbi:MAG TPA: Amuc_1100 family pilus-like protein, partial [Candidatus Baltobacteraceae bacterium]|nr:Amuc_1100 family pilus-like protein [Candidatus Baltobacteraceae bacterium]